jgi:hypothetical protein
MATNQDPAMSSQYVCCFFFPSLRPPTPLRIMLTPPDRKPSRRGLPTLHVSPSSIATTADSRQSTEWPQDSQARPRPQASPYICLARSPPDQLSPACNWRRRWAVAKRPPYTSRAACRMGVRMPSPTQTSRPAGGARAVPHIRDRGALALWMGGSAGQRLPGLSTRHCHLLLSMAYGSPKGRQTLRLLWGPCTLSAAMVVPGWSGMGA